MNHRPKCERRNCETIKRKEDLGEVAHFYSTPNVLVEGERGRKKGSIPKAAKISTDN